MACLPVRCQDFFWTNRDFLLIGPLWTTFGEIWINNTIFIKENEFQNVVCKMVAILSQLQYVKALYSSLCLSCIEFWYADFFSEHKSVFIFHIILQHWNSKCWDSFFNPWTTGSFFPKCNLFFWYYVFNCLWFNTLRPRQNGRNFANDAFKCIFLNENVRILIRISLKLVPKGPSNNIPALVQIMAWRRSGNKPLSEPMMVSLLTHICVTQPQWVNTLCFIWHHRSWSTLVNEMTWCLITPSHYLIQC